MTPPHQNQSPGDRPIDNQDPSKSSVECEICSQLRDIEDGCVKEYDDALVLPAESARLASIPGSRMNSLEKCPLCGTYYEYFHFYEYSPDGNDEEAHLRRLSHAEALKCMIEEEIYAELENFAQRSASNAKMVLNAINQSRMKRDTLKFQTLQNICIAMKDKQGNP